MQEVYSTLLNASYLRTIRISSFFTEQDAENSFVKFQSYLLEHENLQRLEKENEFEFKVRKSGNYYVILAEPFTNKNVLQEVLDTLRKDYEDIYVTKLQESTLTKKLSQIEKSRPNVSTKEQVTTQITPLIAEPAYLEPEMSEVKPIIEENETLMVESKSLRSDSLEQNNSSSWFFPFIGVLLTLLVSLFYLIKYRKERDLYINKDIITSGKIDQIREEVKRKDMILSHTTHELRTPMTSIMGLTHLVLENELEVFQKEYVKQIESSATHLLNIINDILDVSKMDAGKLSIEQKEFNINNIFDYVLNNIAIQTKNNDISMNMKIAKDVPSHVVGDSLRVGQILINLLANAVKFTKQGHVLLEVNKVNSYGNSVQLEFIVSDTGIGMTKEQVGSLFESFSQASQSTSREFGGTGLGLAISKQLVEMMHGKINVKSQKDIGTTFSFTIPFTLKDADNKRQYRLPSASFLNKHILIVDSSNQNAIALIGALGYFNYATYVIPSFEETKIDIDKQYDIIIISQKNLTDLAKSTMERIVSTKGDKPKVVVLSEQYSNLNMQILEKFHVNSYLKVPFTQQDILNMIVELYVAKNLDKTSRKKSIKDKLKSLVNKKILIAEDNVLNHKVIDGLMRNTGIELMFVLDGQEVLDLLHKDLQFDMILMDINMPIMNGYETTKEIRKNSKYNTLPIYALTADAQEEAVEQALLSGMQGYITKPIVVDTFYNKILDVLSSTDNKSYTKPLAQEYNQEEYEELSISMGLSRCDNDRAFYESILKDFLTMYTSSAVGLEKMCINGEFSKARKMAMDIKDVSLNIGAYNLCESVAAIEYELEKGARGNWREHVTLYANDLKKLFADMEKYLQKG